MTKLIFFKDGNSFAGFQCKNHSGYAQNGQDIVCSAVSTAVQLTACYLLKYHNNDIIYSVDERNASITLRCKKLFLEADRQISILFEFANSLSNQYPNYFTFDFLEV